MVHSCCYVHKPLHERSGVTYDADREGYDIWPKVHPDLLLTPSSQESCSPFRFADYFKTRMKLVVMVMLSMATASSAVFSSSYQGYSLWVRLITSTFRYTSILGIYVTAHFTIYRATSMKNTLVDTKFKIRMIATWQVPSYERSVKLLACFSPEFAYSNYVICYCIDLHCLVCRPAQK